MGIWHSFNRAFAAVATGVEATVKVVDAAASGVDLLDNYITKAKREQSLAHKLSAKDFLDDLINEASITRAKKLATMEKEISQDQDVSKHFNSCISEYKTLFAAELSPAQP
jgi:hypothetical protein